MSARPNSIRLNFLPLWPRVCGFLNTPRPILLQRRLVGRQVHLCPLHAKFPNQLAKHGGYFLKLYQHRSYVLALDNAPDVHGMYVDENEKGLSFRNYNGLLLAGAVAGTVPAVLGGVVFQGAAHMGAAGHRGGQE